MRKKVKITLLALLLILVGASASQGIVILKRTGEVHTVEVDVEETHPSVVTGKTSFTWEDDFLDESKNKVACKRFYYEVPIITLLFRASMLLCALSFVSSLALLLRESMPAIASISDVLEKGLYVCVVASCFLAFGCSYIAGGHNE